MKSEFANGVRLGCPCPSPVPIKPPDARPNRPVTNCSEPPWRLYTFASKGCSQASIRLSTCANMRLAMTAPAANARMPMTIQLFRPVATYSMHTNIAKNMSDVPKSR